MIEKAKRGRPRKSELKPSKQELAKYAEPRNPVTETDAIIHAITSASRDPKVDIAKMDWLLKTAVALKDDQARQDYNDAMARVQAALEPVRKEAWNPQTSSRYASEAALDAAIRPFYAAENFTLSFDTEPMPERNENWVLVVCYCARGREKRRHQIPMPCDGLGPKGSPVMTRTHATGSAFSYGRRYLRCAIFNVLTADMAKADDDGNAAGRYQPKPDVGRTAHYDAHEERINPSATTPAHDPKTGEIKEPQQAPKAAIMALRAIMKRAEVEEDLVTETFGVEKLEDLTEDEVRTAVKKCNKKLEQMTEAMHERSNKAPLNG